MFKNYSMTFQVMFFGGIFYTISFLVFLITRNILFSTFFGLLTVVLYNIFVEDLGLKIRIWRYEDKFSKVVFFAALTLYVMDIFKFKGFVYQVLQTLTAEGFSTLVNRMVGINTNYTMVLFNHMFPILFGFPPFIWVLFLLRGKATA